MEWKNLTDGSFKGFRFHCSIPSKKTGVHGATSQKTAFERRLQIINYPGKNGTKVNDHGGNGDVIDFEILFFGPDYLKQYDDFVKVLNDGEPGILVCPVKSRAVVAYFQKASDVVEVGSGSTIKLSVTFVEDTSIDPNELAPPQATIKVEAAGKLAALGEKVAAAKKALNSNQFIDAVRTASSGLSAAKRYSNAVVAIDQNIRNRLISSSDELGSTLDILTGAISVIAKIGATATIPTNPTNIVDPDTGLEVVPFDQDTPAVTEEDPLTPPPVSTITPETNPDLSSGNLSSGAGIEIFTDAASEILTDKKEEIAAIGGGKTDEVTKAVSQVVIALNDYQAAVAIDKGVPVIVPANLSMMEILFYNGRSLDLLKQTISKNRHVDDVLIVPAGSVVYL